MKIYHTAVSQPDYVDAAMRTFWQIHMDQPPGDVLIFLPGITNFMRECTAAEPWLPGQEDIEGLERSLQLYMDRLPKETQSVSPAPLHDPHRR